MADESSRRIFAAIERLKAGDRAAAAELLGGELQQGPSSGERWRSVQRLAEQIGEIDIALEAARRFSRTEPVLLGRLLHYWAELAAYGRAEEAIAELGKLPPQLATEPSALHLQGTVSGQMGDFDAAESCFRAAIAKSPALPQTWFALAMIKQFEPGDPDIAVMESLLPALEDAEPSVRSRFLYGLAKALHDYGDYDRAFALYSQGAGMRRQEERFDSAALERFVDRLVGDFTPGAMRALTPSSDTGPTPLFINGLPRSGTTLVEQILTSHSGVADGAEVNLMRAALQPTHDNSLEGALRYQALSGAKDPWGAVAADYRRMLRMRFPHASGLLVDKTLGQSHLMGLLLHSLPNARVVWMRRDPEDTALSCFRTYFTAPVGWSWSLADIGRFFRQEERLHAHWCALFPGQILTVDYEALVRDPDEWIRRIAGHCGLAVEPGLFEAHKAKRSVQTASVQQVRAPISTKRIGAAQTYAKHLAAFREAYSP